jgi:hypothetical protein
MSQFSLNHYLNGAKTLKQQTCALYEDVLGASVLSLRLASEISSLPRIRGLGCPMSIPARRSHPSST